MRHCECQTNKQAKKLRKQPLDTVISRDPVPPDFEKKRKKKKKRAGGFKGALFFYILIRGVVPVAVYPARVSQSYTEVEWQR